MRIFQEDSTLGISKVVWKFSNEPLQAPLEGVAEAAELSLQSDASDVFAQEVIGTDVPYENTEGIIPESVVEAPVQTEHLTDMRQMIQFLQQVVDNQNQQLKTKDELIRNFQVLLKSEQEQVMKLETAMVEKQISVKAEKQEFGWITALKKKLMKQ